MGTINGHETRISANWLRMRLNEPETAQRICLIDSTPTMAAPCLPYARPLDACALVQDGLPTAATFEAAVRAIGATTLDQVVVYDRNFPPAASVLWRLFRAFGHRDVCILEGGYQAWRDACGELAARYALHDQGTWRAAAPASDRELLAEIRLLQQTRPSA